MTEEDGRKPVAPCPRASVLKRTPQAPPLCSRAETCCQQMPRHSQKCPVDGDQITNRPRTGVSLSSLTFLWNPYQEGRRGLRRLREGE